MFALLLGIMLVSVAPLLFYDAQNKRFNCEDLDLNETFLPSTDIDKSGVVENPLNRIVGHCLDEDNEDD
jgi:hypothetical protein